MLIEDDEDYSYLTNTQYDDHFELEGLPAILTQGGHARNDFSSPYQNLNT